MKLEQTSKHLVKYVLNDMFTDVYAIQSVSYLLS